MTGKEFPGGQHVLSEAAGGSGAMPQQAQTKPESQGPNGKPRQGLFTGANKRRTIFAPCPSEFESDEIRDREEADDRRKIERIRRVFQKTYNDAGKRKAPKNRIIPATALTEREQALQETTKQMEEQLKTMITQIQNEKEGQGLLTKQLAETKFQVEERNQVTIGVTQQTRNQTSTMPNGAGNRGLELAHPEPTGKPESIN